MLLSRNMFTSSSKQRGHWNISPISLASLERRPARRKKKGLANTTTDHPRTQQGWVHPILAQHTGACRGWGVGEGLLPWQPGRANITKKDAKTKAYGVWTALDSRTYASTHTTSVVLASAISVTLKEMTKLKSILDWGCNPPNLNIIKNWRTTVRSSSLSLP